MSRQSTRRRQFWAHLSAIAACLLFMSTPAWAWPPTWGAEFEMTKPGVRAGQFNKENPAGTIEKQMQMDFIAAMRERCLGAKCQIRPVPGKYPDDQDYQITFADGFYFKVSYDPGCIEITFKPSTREQIRSKAKVINEQIFGTAKAIGLGVRNDKNSHVNMGVASAFASAEQFTRYFVDYTNHPELALGALGAKDLRNAPPLSILRDSQREALQVVIGAVKNHQLTTVSAVASAILEEVYTESYHKPWGGEIHYQAVGLKYIWGKDLDLDDAPMELRSVWIQDSAERFLHVTDLLEARLLYLSRLREPILYNRSARVDFSPSELKTRFAIYVEETGRKFAEFSDLLPPAVVKASFDAFFDKTKPIQEQLASMKMYRDLLLTSPWARARAQEIIADPRLAHEVRREVEINALQALIVDGPKTENEVQMNQILRGMLAGHPLAGPRAMKRCEALFASHL